MNDNDDDNILIITIVLYIYLRPTVANKIKKNSSTRKESRLTSHFKTLRRKYNIFLDYNREYNFRLVR